MPEHLATKSGRRAPVNRRGASVVSPILSPDGHYGTQSALPPNEVNDYVRQSTKMHVVDLALASIAE